MASPFTVRAVSYAVDKRLVANNALQATSVGRLGFSHKVSGLLKPSGFRRHVAGLFVRLLFSFEDFTFGEQFAPKFPSSFLGIAHALTVPCRSSYVLVCARPTSFHASSRTPRWKQRRVPLHSSV